MTSKYRVACRCIDERTFDWIRFRESIPEEMAKIVMRMRGFMSGYQAHLSRGVAYQFTHPGVQVVFEMRHPGFVAKVKWLIQVKRLQRYVEAGDELPGSPFIGSSLNAHIYSGVETRIPVEKCVLVIVSWSEAEWRDVAVDFP